MSETISYPIGEALKSCLANGGNGFIINPFGEAPFMLTKELIQVLYDVDEEARERSTS